jgi:GT2 family glycosyltransferase
MIPPDETPTFTIVIPAYNAARTVEETLRSVLAQTRSDFEAIVVDDGSTDDTPERVRRYTADPRVILVEREHAGLAATRNAGIERMRGRFVTLVDSDDLLMPDYLERMALALERDPDASWVFTDPWVLDDRSRRIRRHTLAARTAPPGPLPRDPEELLAQLIVYNFVFVAATIRREALEDVGVFDTSLPLAEDYELWLRLAARGHRAVRAPGHLAIYRKGHDSLSADELALMRTVRDIMRRVSEEWDVPERARTLARERIAALGRHVAVLNGDRGRAATAAYRAESLARSFRQLLLRPRKWPARPPPEVASAFPELRRS